MQVMPPTYAELRVSYGLGPILSAADNIMAGTAYLRECTTGSAAPVSWPPTTPVPAAIPPSRPAASACRRKRGSTSRPWLHRRPDGAARRRRRTRRRNGDRRRRRAAQAGRPVVEYGPVASFAPPEPVTIVPVAAHVEPAPVERPAAPNFFHGRDENCFAPVPRPCPCPRGRRRGGRALAPLGASDPAAACVIRPPARRSSRQQTLPAVPDPSCRSSVDFRCESSTASYDGT